MEDRWGDGMSTGCLRMQLLRQSDDRQAHCGHSRTVLLSSLMVTGSLFVLLLTSPSCCLELEALVFVRLRNIPLFLSLSTINYLNSSPKLPSSMLLYFLTGNLSAATLWPLATLLHCPGNLYSTPGFVLLSNLSLPNARHFLVTTTYFYGRADVITFLFVPHLLGHSLQENELYNTKDEMDVVQSTWGQFAPTGLGWCFQLAI